MHSIFCAPLKVGRFLNRTKTRMLQELQERNRSSNITSKVVNIGYMFISYGGFISIDGMSDDKWEI